MTAYKGLGTYGNAVGVVTPLDHKLSNAAMVVKQSGNLIRPGLFWGGNATIVTGKANMSYDVAAYSCATTRGATSGAVFGGNDGVLNVATTAAPGSNSRYDVIYHWHREFSIDGVDSNPVIGVIQGSPAASPTVPSLAAFPGAIEIGRVLVPAGVTATNTGTTITQTAPFTSMAGGMVPFRTTTEMNLWTTALTDQRALDLSTGILCRFNGVAWKPWGSDWIAYTPTLTGFALGAGGVNSCRYKYINGDVVVEYKLVFGTSGQTFPSSPTIALPVNATTPAHDFAVLTGAGSVFHVISGVANKSFVTSNVSTVNAVRVWTGDYGTISPSAPFTWAASDILQGSFRYAAA